MNIRTFFSLPLLLLALFSMPNENIAATDFTNWPAVQEWVDLTNDIQRCYDAYNARYRARYGGTQTLRPTFIYPFSDYKLLADKIDALAIKYIDTTKADENGDFTDYFNENPTNGIPYWTVTNIHANAGFDNWATSEPLDLWMCVDHTIQTQVWSCLNLLTHTYKSSGFTSSSDPNDLFCLYNEYPNYKSVYVRTNSRAAALSAIETMWDTATPEDRGGGITEIAVSIGVSSNTIWHYWQASAQRYWINLYTTGMWTNVPHTIDWYYFAWPLSGEFSAQGTGVSTNMQRIPGPTTTSNTVISSSIGQDVFDDFPDIGSSNGCGFSMGTWDTLSIIEWQFPSITPPTGYPKVEDPDTDRDDLVDIGVSIDSFGPDTGLITFNPEQDNPHVVIPVASTPVWYGGLPVYAYLAQGGTTNLPFHYLIQDWPVLSDEDGPYQAFSLRTRIIQSGAVQTADKKAKRAAVLRPRGNVVIFDFPWDSGSSSFSPIGYPIGINSNRSYIIRDVTPSSHTDLKFDLMFESGVIHQFDRTILNVKYIDNRTIPTTASTIPGGSITFPTSAKDARYNVSLSFTNGLFRYLTYTTKDNSQAITTTITYDQNKKITGLTKTGITGIGKSDVSVFNDTIQYSWGSASRSQTAPIGQERSVTLTTDYTDHGTLSDVIEYDEANRPLVSQRIVNGNTASFTREFYTDAGRYANGMAKNAKLKKLTYPDGSTVEFTYATDTGWLTQEKRPVGNGSERLTTYAYSHTGDSTANPTNLCERPRVVSQLYDATTIGTTYFAYNGPSETEIQECAVAGAAWDAAANLVTTNTYCTNGLTNGLLIASSTPMGTSAFSYQIAGLSGSDFTAPGKLTAASVHSTGQTVTNVVNAFGTRETAVTVDTDSGQVTASAVSTVDAFGRSTQTAFLDGTSESYSSWTLHGPEEIIGVDGSVSTYEYYDNGLVKEIDRGDTGVLLNYEYDALGNIIAATATGDDAASVLSSASYDALSRPISRTDILGTTTYDYANQSYGVETTITYADNSVLTRQKFHDGSIKQISGNAAKAKRQYEYGIDSGLFYAKQIRPVGAATTEWTKKTFDALGKVAQIENSGAGGDATTLSFDAKGRMNGWEDEEGVARVFTYTDRNEVQDAGLDSNGDGSLVAASRDRYLTSAYNVTASGRKYSGYVYPTADSANSNLLAEIEVALDGAHITSSYAGRTDTRARGPYGSGGSFNVTNALSDGTKLVQDYEAWRLKETKRYESGSGSPWETETLDYDGLGALREVDNSRNGVTTLEYDSARRLAKVTLPDPTKLPIEIKYWDGTDRIKSIRRPDGSFLRLDYYPNGLLKRRYDLGTYDVSFEYDDQGRCVKQTTDRDGTPVATEWIYEATSGLLEEKKIAGVTAETYTYRDNRQVATVTDANDVLATHAYNGAGDLTGVTYSDGKTDPITVAFNRCGQVEASGQGGVSNLFVYALDSQTTTNTVVGAGVVPEAQLAYSYGAMRPGLESAVFTVNGEARAVEVGRNARNLVTSLSDGNVSASYTYASGAPFVNAVTVTVDGVGAMIRTIGWDLVNDRMTNIACTVAGSNVASFAYTWQTNSDRIARITLSDGSYWTYDYDSRGHLTSGERFFADGTPYFGLQYGAKFDSIGNTLEGGPLSGGVPENSFTPNNLNVHVSRVWSNKVEILGRAATNATVTINDTPTDRAEEWFRAVITVNNAASAVETNIAITAVWFDPVASNDVVASTTGSLCIAKASEGPSYDARASITNDSRYRMIFDAFGRLTEAINTAVSPFAMETYTYFADGRRATKKTFRGSLGAWTNTFSHAFIYDRWNLIHERVTDEIQATTTTREYVWGLDLVGQRDGEIGQEAGGIGGLLAIREIVGGVTNIYLPIADHNGNILHLVDAANHEVVANYLYAPFGALVGAWGPKRDVCPFRFQSKYYDAETELYYFGYRYYNPASVKWITRDPLGEKGGINLTANCRNDPINNTDPLGLEIYELSNASLFGVIDVPGGYVPYYRGTTPWEDLFAQAANIGGLQANTFYRLWDLIGMAGEKVDDISIAITGQNSAELYMNVQAAGPYAAPGAFPYAVSRAGTGLRSIVALLTRGGRMSRTLALEEYYLINGRLIPANKAGVVGNLGRRLRIPATTISSDLQHQALAHLTESGTTVLGRRIHDYVGLAERMKASYFDMGENWDYVNGWLANKHFLDVIAARGDDIVLATKRGGIPSTSDLYLELQYLIENWGYRWIDETHLGR